LRNELKSLLGKQEQLDQYSLVAAALSSGLLVSYLAFTKFKKYDLANTSLVSTAGITGAVTFIGVYSEKNKVLIFETASELQSFEKLLAEVELKLNEELKALSLN
jgi:hypothetical protein